ncbi:extracellular solute-binding protein family 3 [Pseudodesulfovibrio mercurii]|uniref:Extracellular solute-binding protein family 3 n=1 Tax=Pseudodesulfovibrio mercurii TaxID=641491 RepID=F0JBC3_9BACT|nr:transporter substrate-binding domain-containing protein [Pseudodesulfovibrio mercurii]EGB14242.1 extracellular solute-binding protein family 3 [Pseudodesulfovibrio mercurii]
MYRIFALGVCLTLFLPVAVFGGDFNMQAIVYPPLVYADEGRLWGVAPEVILEIQKAVGDDSPLRETPWLRGYEQTQKLSGQALFAIVRIPEREKLFKWVGPIFGEGDYFFKHRGSPLRIETLDDAREVLRIAVRKDGYTHQALAARGFTNLDVGPTYESSYRKLVQDRVDLVLMGERTYYYMVRQAGLDPAEFERTDCKFGDSAAWLAFSLDVPDETVRKWQDALDALKESGVYQDIMERNFTP